MIEWWTEPPQRHLGCSPEQIKNFVRDDIYTLGVKLKYLDVKCEVLMTGTYYLCKVEILWVTWYLQH